MRDYQLQRANDNFSTWFGNNIGFLSFVIFPVFSIVWLISKTQRGGFAIDSFKLNIPVFGSLIEQSILNKFCKTFGILIGAGVPVLETTALLRKLSIIRFMKGLSMMHRPHQRWIHIHGAEKD